MAEAGLALAQSTGYTTPLCRQAPTAGSPPPLLACWPPPDGSFRYFFCPIIPKELVFRSLPPPKPSNWEISSPYIDNAGLIASETGRMR